MQWYQVSDFKYLDGCWSNYRKTIHKVNVTSVVINVIMLDQNLYWRKKSINENIQDQEIANTITPEDGLFYIYLTFGASNLIKLLFNITFGKGIKKIDCILTRNHFSLKKSKVKGIEKYYENNTVFVFINCDLFHKTSIFTVNTEEFDHTSR